MTDVPRFGLFWHDAAPAEMQGAEKSKTSSIVGMYDSDDSPCRKLLKRNADQQRRNPATKSTPPKSLSYYNAKLRVPFARRTGN